MCVNVCIARLCEHAEDGSQKVYNNSNQEAMPVSDAGATLDQHCIDIALFDGLPGTLLYKMLVNSMVIVECIK